MFIYLDKFYLNNRDFDSLFLNIITIFGSFYFIAPFIYYLSFFLLLLFFFLIYIYINEKIKIITYKCVNKI